MQAAEAEASRDAPAALRFHFGQVFGERTEYDEVQDGATVVLGPRAPPLTRSRSSRRPHRRRVRWRG